MEPLDTIKTQFDLMDEEARRNSLIAAVVYVFFVLLGYRQLGRTKDKRLQGPRWLWKVLMPSSAVSISESGVTVVPVGVALFWLLGRKRK